MAPLFGQQVLPLVLAISACINKVSSQAVFAHIVAGNWGSYSQSDWENNCALASQSGIDGFIMNIAPVAATYNFYPMLDFAYDAAESVGNFTIWLSFDYEGGGYPWVAQDVVNVIEAYQDKPAQYKWTTNDISRPAVTTFEGSSNANDWSYIKSQVDIFFIPNYSDIGPASAISQPGVDGLSAWDDAAWPSGPTDITTKGDQEYINALGGKPYMMPVSPWFYRNVYGTNWLWRGDTNWPDRWTQAAQIMPDIIQIITWNDYGESHYIGPLPPSGANAYPAGANYAPSNPHDGWLGTLPYLIETYKTSFLTPGSPAPDPSTVAEQITIWYKPNFSTSGSTGGTMCNPAGRVGVTQYPPGECSLDEVFIHILAHSPATVVVDFNGAVLQTSTVVAGINNLSVAMQTGTPSVTLVRDGATIAEVTGPAIGAPSNGVVNWNAVVASSLNGATI